MSQFDSTFNAPDADADTAPGGTSKMAIASLVCSLICCVWPINLLGVLMGFISIFRIKPPRRGRGLAIVAIIVGLISSAIGGGLTAMVAWGWPLVTQGPGPALTLGASGDLAGFRAAFHGAGAQASDAETQAFFDELNARYGAYQSLTLNQANPQQPGTMGSPVVVYNYVLTFANDPSVDAQASLMWSDPTAGGFLGKFESITIIDPNAGDLTFPPGP